MTPKGGKGIGDFFAVHEIQNSPSTAQLLSRSDPRRTIIPNTLFYSMRVLSRHICSIFISLSFFSLALSRRFRCRHLSTGALNWWWYSVNNKFALWPIVCIVPTYALWCIQEWISWNIRYSLKIETYAFFCTRAVHIIVYLLAYTHGGYGMS